MAIITTINNNVAFTVYQELVNHLYVLTHLTLTILRVDIIIITVVVIVPNLQRRKKTRYSKLKVLSEVLQ